VPMTRILIVYLALTVLSLPKKLFFCYSARSDREGLHGEAQEACGDLTGVSEKAVHAKAPQRSQTADLYEATDKRQASSGSEAASDC
jgi:hypothetical protein